MFNVDARDLFYERSFAYSHALFSLIKRSNLDIVTNTNEAEKNDDSKTIEKEVIEDILFLLPLRRPRDLSYKIDWVTKEGRIW